MFSGSHLSECEMCGKEREREREKVRARLERAPERARDGWRLVDSGS